MLIQTKSNLAILENESLDAVFLRYIGLRQLRLPILRATGVACSYADRPDNRDIDWIQAAGLATLLSFTVYWQSYRPEITVPYNVAWIELDEGPRMISTILEENPSSLRIGMRLSADFEPSGRLVFRVVEGGSSFISAQKAKKEMR